MYPPSPGLAPVPDCGSSYHNYYRYDPAHRRSGHGSPKPLRPRSLLPSAAGHQSTDTDSDAAEAEADTPYLTDPPLQTLQATRDVDATAALGVISDNVAREQFVAVHSIVTHPAVLAGSGMTLLTAAKLLLCAGADAGSRTGTGQLSDVVLVLACWAMLAAVGLLCLRLMISGYASLAAQVGNWSWLSQSSVNGRSTRRDELIVTKAGDEVVGVVVLRIAKTVGLSNQGYGGSGLHHHASGNNKNNTNAITNPLPADATTTAAASPTHHAPRSSRRKSSSRWTALIRAWSVSPAFQHRGIGTALLSETVAYARLRGLDGPVFADDHAHANADAPLLVMRGMFGAPFRAREAWARGLLAWLVGDRGE